MRISAVRFMLYTVAAFAASGSFAYAEEDAGSSDVVVLNTDNFKEWVAGQNLALVEFYAPWCGHCKSLAPIYEKVATTLKDEGISLAKVDCTEEQSLCEEMQIPGFPSLKVFKDGNHAAYNGSRQEEGIISYMRKQLLPPLSQLTEDSFAKFTKSDRVVVIGFIDDSESTEYTNLEALANELRDEYTFGVIADKALAKEQGAKVPGIVVYKDFDYGKDVFEGKIAVDEIRNFVKASSVPTFGEISGENYAQYAQSGLPFAFAFFDSDETRKELEEEVYNVAKENKGVISFVLIDGNKYGSQADHLNLERKWPAFAIQNQTSLSKYPFPQDKDITEKNIREFVADFIEGKIEADYKSEPVPESNDGNVFTLVSKQFNEIAFDKTKDVLVEFYAPWCSYCKRLAPVYEELGEKLKVNKNLVISKMDAVANDVPSDNPSLQIQGFPTIVLVRGEDNSVVEYTGDRSLKSLIEFIEENAAFKIEKQDDADSKKEDSDDVEDDEEEEEEEDVKKPEDKKADADAEEEEKKDGDDENAAHDEL
ncbi:protein disulfide-isomerase precursor [Coemansia sp. RSA 1939]|nr:protein disulfide-isomerase precursor [Coemansia sp. RSA 1939]KAJ2607369.1 protein disulfide-isomerase precursor [Coemansia sp. RSA 1804]KAJ2685433.1 protein disulfide-isomerase precursor [Coemansia sp. RSA 1285]